MTIIRTRVNLTGHREKINSLWADLAKHAEPFMRDYFTPYLTVTAILAVAMVDMQKAQFALPDFKDFAKEQSLNSSKHHAWHEIGLPILEGCLAYINKNYTLAIELLKPIYNAN